MKSRKSWKEKLEKANVAKIEPIPPLWEKRYGPGNLLIPPSMEIDAFVRSIPAGQTTSIGAIREHFAKKYKVTVTCPLTTGIFLRMIAENTEEERAQGRPDITPYWRVLRDNGKGNEKFPGGIEAQKQALLAEGVDIQ